MQAPDITAGRGALSALSESIGHIRGAHAQMQQVMQNFTNQVQASGAGIHGILEREDLKAYQRMRDQVADAQAQRVQDLKEQAHALNVSHSAWQQKQAEIANQQWEKNYALSKKQLESMNALRAQQGAQIAANIRAQNLDNYAKAYMFGSNGSWQGMVIQNKMFAPFWGGKKAPTPPPLKKSFKAKRPAVPNPSAPAASAPLVNTPAVPGVNTSAPFGAYNRFIRE